MDNSISDQQSAFNTTTAAAANVTADSLNCTTWQSTMQAYQQGAYLQQLDAIAKSVDLLRTVSARREQKSPKVESTGENDTKTTVEPAAPLNVQQAAELFKSIHGYLNQAEKCLKTFWPTDNAHNSSNQSLSIIASAATATNTAANANSPRTSVSTSDGEDAGEDTDAGGVNTPPSGRPSTIRFAEVSKVRRRDRSLARKSSVHSDADVDTDTDIDGGRGRLVLQPMPIYRPAKSSLRSLLGFRSYGKAGQIDSPISGEVSPDSTTNNITLFHSAPPSAAIPGTTPQRSRTLALRNQGTQLRMRGTKSLDALRFRSKDAGTPRPSTSSAEYQHPGARSLINDRLSNVLAPVDATDSSSGEEEDEEDVSPTDPILDIPPESPLPCEADLGLIDWRFRIPAASRTPARNTVNTSTKNSANSEPNTPSTTTPQTIADLVAAVPSPRTTVANTVDQHATHRSLRNTGTSSNATIGPTRSATVVHRSSGHSLINQALYNNIGPHSTASPSSCSSSLSYLPISARSSMEQSLQHSMSMTPGNATVISSASTADLANLEVSPDFLPAMFCDVNDMTPARTTDGLAVSSSSSNPHRPPDRVPMVPRSPLLSTHIHLTNVLEVQIAELRRLQGLSIEAAWRENGMEAQYEAEVAKTPHGLVAPPEVSEIRAFKARLVEQQQRRITNTRAGMNHLATLVQVAAATPTIQSFPYRIVAYQLTLLDATLFSQIPPEAILSHSALEHSLLSLDEPTARTAMLHRWSKVAKALRDLRSYQMLLAVVGGLQTPPIRRLKRTWAHVPKRDMYRVQRLQRLVSPDNNYSRYRELLNKAASSGWHVPCLSVFLLDATYLASACKTARTPLLEDARVQELLGQMQLSLASCHYPATPPSWMLKSRTRNRPALFGSLTLPPQQQQQQQQQASPSQSHSMQRQPSLNNLSSPPSQSNLPTTSDGNASNTSPGLAIPMSPEKLRHRRSSSLGSRMGLEGWLVRAQDRLPAVVSGITRTTSPPPVNGSNLLSTGANSLPGSGAITPTSVSGTPSNAMLSTMSSPVDQTERSSSVAKAIYATRVTQFLIVHHLVTRPWMEDTVADRLSLVREPPRNKGGIMNGGSNTAGSIGGLPIDASQFGSTPNLNGLGEGNSSSSSVSYLRRRASGSVAKWGYGVTLQERFHYKKDSSSQSKK
ncbi:hypothetical protein BDF19DRAFT_421793 [Syncephalis fuscata]|nr:hypothetical protein BDF19DRAFT_421793 [Syncephalis fuscata]